MALVVGGVGSGDNDGGGNDGGGNDGGGNDGGGGGGKLCLGVTMHSSIAPSPPPHNDVLLFP